MASINVRQHRQGTKPIRSLAGPLFDEETDLLAVAEEILDLPTTAQVTVGNDYTKALAGQLIMMDIARSLRAIAQRPPVSHTTFRNGHSHGVY